MGRLANLGRQDRALERALDGVGTGVRTLQLAGPAHTKSNIKPVAQPGRRVLIPLRQPTKGISVLRNRYRAGLRADGWPTRRSCGTIPLVDGLQQETPHDSATRSID